MKHTCVDDVDDALDRQRRLGDVRRENDLAALGRRRLKDLRLLLRRHRRVDRQDDKLFGLASQRAHALRERLGRRLDLVLARHKHENVTGRCLCYVNLRRRQNEH